MSSKTPQEIATDAEILSAAMQENLQEIKEWGITLQDVSEGKKLIDEYIYNERRQEEAKGAMMLWTEAKDKSAKKLHEWYMKQVRLLRAHYGPKSKHLKDYGIKPSRRGGKKKK